MSKELRDELSKEKLKEIIDDILEENVKIDSVSFDKDYFIFYLNNDTVFSVRKKTLLFSLKTFI